MTSVLWFSSVLPVSGMITRSLPSTPFLWSLKRPEMCGLLGYFTASCGNYLPTFRDNVSVPSSRVKIPILCPETSVNNYHTTPMLVVSVITEQEWSTSILSIVGEPLPAACAVRSAHGHCVLSRSVICHLPRADNQLFALLSYQWSFIQRGTSTVNIIVYCCCVV
jgi:hypothetical protein